MLNVYCIPGMGVDERLFSNLKLDDCSIHHIKWETPFKNESLADYAMRLSMQIDQTQPFVLIGVSFGGMCCSEIARKLNPVKTFLISSCKTSDELPKALIFEKFLPIHKLLNDKSFIRGTLLIRERFGVINKEQTALFDKMLHTAPENYFRGAAHCIINWEQHIEPENSIHIHGTADKVLPYKKIKNCNYSIKDGTHWMVMDKAEEISEIINKELHLHLLK